MASRNGFGCESIFGLFPTVTMATIISLFLLSLCLRVTQVSATKMEVVKGSSILNIYDSEEELSISLSDYILDLSTKFGEERGVFTIALTGDSLIDHMRKLMEVPYVNQINWSQWYVFWADERVVPKVMPMSNYKLDNDAFLSKVPIPKDHIISIDDKLTAEEAAEDYESRIRELVQNQVIATSNATNFPKFDVILLGLGHNGHVASLMPNRPQLNEDKKWVTYIKDSPKPPPQRITMTFPVINSSPNVALVVLGDNMASTVSAVIDGGQSSTQLPAQMVSPVEGGLKWFLDKGATSMLNI